MKIARHWKRSRMQAMLPDGKPIVVTAWGWSADSSDEALMRAEEAVHRSAQRIAAGEGFPDSYGYGDRPAREEILEEIKNETDETIAMVTRNRYGALVLNTKDLMFIDIDVPRAGSGGLIRMIKSLFGIKTEDPYEQAHARIAELASSRPEYAMRLYRTAAGFRCAVINKRIRPGSPESDSLLAAFGSDPLYIRLCKNQESFRARLTPKFWRCDFEAPRGRFPFDNEASERRYREWERGYNAASAPYATCKFVEQFGSQQGVADFRKLLEMHDRETKADSDLPLA